jgi:hypothetical protein
MSAYEVLLTHEPSPVEANEVTLIASGDLRESANKVCWPAQAKMEGELSPPSSLKEWRFAALIRSIRAWTWFHPEPAHGHWHERLHGHPSRCAFDCCRSCLAVQS